MAELADLLREVADGTPPTTDAELTVLAPPDDHSVGVLAFPGRHIVVADVAEDWVRSWLPAGDLIAPLAPPFLSVLAAVTGRCLGSLDAVLVGRGNGRRQGTELDEVDAVEHPRVARALLHRGEVRTWVCPGGVLALGRGVAGRWEAAVEVDPEVRGFGLGRGLFRAALGLVPPGEAVWTQVAPGNAASLRAVLAAGYQPVGAEVLLSPWTDMGTPIDWFAGTEYDFAAEEAEAAAELEADEGAELAERPNPQL